MIKELKIGVEWIKESYENKLDKIGIVVFDYREKKKDLKFMKKRNDSFRTIEVNVTARTFLPNCK